MAGEKENCDTLYNAHCKAEFSDIKQTLSSVKTVLCGDPLAGRIGIDERVRGMDERVKRLEKDKDKATDVFGPVLGVLVKNWKAISVVMILLFSIWQGFKSGTPLTAEQIRHVIRQVIESEQKQLGTAPAEPKKDYPIN